METRGKRETVSSTFRLTTETRRLLALLSRKKGISMAAVLELVVRQAAKDEGVR